MRAEKKDCNRLNKSQRISFLVVLQSHTTLLWGWIKSFSNYIRSFFSFTFSTHISSNWNILRIENESENIENFWGVLKDNKSKLSKRLMRLKFYILFFLSSVRLSTWISWKKWKWWKKNRIENATWKKYLSSVRFIRLKVSHTRINSDNKFYFVYMT